MDGWHERYSAGKDKDDIIKERWTHVSNDCATVCVRCVSAWERARPRSRSMGPPFSLSLLLVPFAPYGISRDVLYYCTMYHCPSHCFLFVSLLFVMRHNRDWSSKNCRHSEFRSCLCMTMTKTKTKTKTKKAVVAKSCRKKFHLFFRLRVENRLVHAPIGSYMVLPACMVGMTRMLLRKNPGDVLGRSIGALFFLSSLHGFSHRQVKAPYPGNVVFFRSTW